MKISSETTIEKYNIVFEKINEIKGSNYIALQGNFLVYDDEKNIVTRLKPENRFYPIKKNFTLNSDNFSLKWQILTEFTSTVYSSSRPSTSKAIFSKIRPSQQNLS